VNSEGKLAGAITSQLPFTLTGAQQRVCGEILADLRKATPMLRLLQGDVGSGKTLVAALTAAHMVESKHQVALMAPTELLSEQHFAGFQKWFEPLGINVLWLTGQVKGKARKWRLSVSRPARSTLLWVRMRYFRMPWYLSHWASC
jgi:ATP-dependent DNA helicase RecG